MQITVSDSFEFSEVEPLSLPLVNRFYKQCRYPAKAGKGEQVYSLRQNAVIVAAVKLMPKDVEGRQWLFLRAMCVLPERRNEGIGALFLEYLRKTYKHPVYCYPFDHLLGFYSAGGYYQPSANSQIPDVIAAGQKRLLKQGRKVKLMVYDDSDNALK